MSTINPTSRDPSVNGSANNTPVNPGRPAIIPSATTVCSSVVIKSQATVDPEVTERFNQLMKENSNLLIKAPPFSPADSKKLQDNLRALKNLQTEGEGLTPDMNESLSALIEVLSLAYSDVSGEDFSRVSFYIPPEQLEVVVKTPIRIKEQFQTTTVQQEARAMQEAQAVIDEGDQTKQSSRLAAVPVDNAKTNPDKQLTDLDQDIKDLNDQNVILNEEIVIANGQIVLSDDFISTLEEIQKILNATPAPPVNSPDFAASLAKLLSARDTLQAQLDKLLKAGGSLSDPALAGIKEVLDQLNASFPLDKYPVGTTVKSGTIYVYELNPKANIQGDFFAPTMTPEWVDNFVKFMNGDPTATPPEIGGISIADSPENMDYLKKLLLNVTSSSKGTIIIKPDGTQVSPNDARSDFLQFSNQSDIRTNVENALSEQQSILDFNQNIINTNQNAITNNQNSIQAKQQEINTIKADLNQKIADLIHTNPEFKAILDKVAGIVSSASTETVFSIRVLIESLIDLCQILQKLASAEAKRLSIVSQKLQAYSQLLSQVPIGKEADKYNPQFQNAQDNIRANKGLEEDLAKQIQTLLQSIKDANQTLEDFTGTILNMLAGISQKMMK